MSQAPARKVTERAQEMFLEYAHYLPERATERIVAHMREAVSRELNDMDLSHPLDGPAVLAHASSIHSGMWPPCWQKGTYCTCFLGIQTPSQPTLVQSIVTHSCCIEYIPVRVLQGARL